MYLEVHMAAPVWSYCFTVRTDLIGLAMLTSAPPKPDGMQACTKCTGDVHFHVLMGRIFVDQLIKDTIYRLFQRMEDEHISIPNQDKVLAFIERNDTTVPELADTLVKYQKQYFKANEQNEEIFAG
jgi:hypothetical protein